MELYHILNRGVDKRVVFTDTQDYVRFYRNLLTLNDIENVPHNQWSIDARLNKKRGSVKKLVEIHSYCLMPNHYHMLISPIADDGIALFMKKINMGYSKYFNERNERTGALWQGKYKSIPILRDSHFNYIPYYIHLNPLDLKFPGWRKGKIDNPSSAFKFLEAYRWSSHQFFLNTHEQNNPVVQDSFLIKSIPQQALYLQEIGLIISDPLLAKQSELIE